MSTEPNIWDDPELQPDGDYISFNVVGDTASGRIERVDVKRWDDGSVSPQLHLFCDDGVERTLTAGQIKLKTALVEARPLPGDHIKIVMTQVEKRSGGKTLKHFDVTVTPRGAAPPAPAPAPASTPAAASAPVDQAALAAAVAAMTPEQRAALGVPG